MRTGRIPAPGRGVEGSVGVYLAKWVECGDRGTGDLGTEAVAAGYSPSMRRFTSSEMTPNFSMPSKIRRCFLASSSHQREPQVQASRPPGREVIRLRLA